MSVVEGPYEVRGALAVEELVILLHAKPGVQHRQPSEPIPVFDLIVVGKPFSVGDSIHTPGGVTQASAQVLQIALGHDEFIREIKQHSRGYRSTNKSSNSRDHTLGHY